jgi:hypothetical protein
MPYLGLRGYSWEEIQYLEAPVAGWNPDAPRNALSANQAPVLDNFLVRQGKIATRGAFANWADLTVAIGTPPEGICGAQPFPNLSGWLWMGRKASGGTLTSGAIDPWAAPIARPPTAAALASSTGNGYTVKGGTVAVGGGISLDSVAGWRGTTFQGKRYFISYDTAGAAVNDTGGTYKMKPLSLNTLDGAGTLVLCTLAPHGALDVKAYQSRIWLAGGIDTPAGGTTFSPTTVFYTVPGVTGSLGTATADWQDPITGLTNNIPLDGDFDNPLVGIATVRNAMLFFRYSAVYALRGTNSATYQIVPVSKEVGTFDARSIVETDNGVYFLSKRGLMLTDGSTIRNVSGPVLQTLQNAVSIVLASIKTGWGGYATCAITSNGQILVSLGAASITAGVLDGHIQPIWCGLFDPSNGTWTRITSTLWATDGTQTLSGSSYPGPVFTTPDRRLLTVGDKYITQLESEQTSSGSLTSGQNNAGTAANDTTNYDGFPWILLSNAIGSFDGVCSASVVGSASQPGSSGAGPGTVTDAGGGTNATGWVAAGGAANLQAALASGGDGEYAESHNSGAGGVTFPKLAVTNWGLIVPAAATLTGMTGYVTDLKTNGGANVTVNAQMLIANVASGSVQTWIGTQPQTYYRTQNFGGSGSLWGAAPTVAQVNASGFGFQVVFASGTNPMGMQVDTAALTVWFTLTKTPYLKLTNFGFTVPTGATVAGVTAGIRKYDLVGGGGIFDDEVKLVKATVVGGTNRAVGSAWLSTLTVTQYGGPADLWGNTLTPADVNSSGFGVAISANGASQPEVDGAYLQITYTMTVATQTTSFVQSSALYDKDQAGNFQYIPARWLTRFAPTGAANRKFVALKRYFLDYIFQEQVPQKGTGWTVTPVDEVAVGAGPVMQAVSGSSLSSGSVAGGLMLSLSGVMQQNQDDAFEADSLAFDIKWVDQQRSVTDGTVVAELFGVGVECQRGRDQR